MAAVDETRFTRVVGMMREATTVQMNTTDIPGVVRLASKDFNITEEESTGVLQRLIEGKDLTLYGLSNAVDVYKRQVPGCASKPLISQNSRGGCSHKQEKTDRKPDCSALCHSCDSIRRRLSGTAFG